MANDLAQGIDIVAATAEAQRAVDSVLPLVFGAGTMLGFYTAKLLHKDQADIAVRIFRVALHCQQAADFCTVDELAEGQYFEIHFRYVETQKHRAVRRACRVEFFNCDESTNTIYDLDGMGGVTARLL